MGWVPDDVIDALRGSHTLGIFVHVDMDEPLRIWLGLNDIPAGIENVDPTTSETYLGAGRLTGVPDLEVLINGVAERVDFTLSGVDPVGVELMELESVEVRGRAVRVGITTLDDDYQPMSAIIPLWSGVASYVSERSAPVSGPENFTVTLSLSVGSGSTTRSRQSASLWSHPHQLAQWALFFPTPELQAANPPDMFCAATARLARGVAPSWPRF